MAYSKPLANSASCKGARQRLAWSPSMITLNAELAAKVGVPDGAFESAWRDTGAQLHAILARGGRVLLHCMAGRGRSGTIAARLLVESGAMAAPEAIGAVRAVRPGAIETAQQVRHVLETTAREPRDA